jgi:hypothetical protein
MGIFDNDILAFPKRNNYHSTKQYSLTDIGSRKAENGDFGGVDGQIASVLEDSKVSSAYDIAKQINQDESIVSNRLRMMIRMGCVQTGQKKPREIEE